MLIVISTIIAKKGENVGCSGNRITMEEIYPILRKCSFFEGIPEDKFPNVLYCLQASKKRFPKGGIIVNIGEQSQMAGVVLSGIVELAIYDENGNQVNVNHISQGKVFGLELACSEQNSSPVQLHTLSDSEILFLNFTSLMSLEAPPCPYRTRVVTNLLRDFAQQTIFLNQKLRIMGQKRLRDKIKVYLQGQELTEDGWVTLPFSRNELADFLYVDRSALSRELSRMKDDGILSYRGQEFHILDPAFLSS